MKPMLFILGLLMAFVAGCQPITITGRIINEENEPVPGASITIKQFNHSVVSNADGQFAIQREPLISYDSLFVDTLIISAVGYETTTYLVNHYPTRADRPLTITLRRSAKLLGEVLVSTGYSQLPKERATGAFEFLNNKTLNRRITTGIIDRLENTSSVYFDRRNGGDDISIRGRSTIFASSSPLIVVDNFPYAGDIGNLNPNDIESITLLKDAAAASVWGAFSGNGVIIITTKKGKLNQSPRLELTSNFTVGQKPDVYYDRNFIDASSFIDVEKFLFSKGFYNSDISNNITFPVLSPVVEILSKRRNNTITAADSAALIGALLPIDVRKQVEDLFYRNSLNQQHAINYSGASNKYNYYLSLGYDHNQAYLVRNDNSRLSIRSSNTFTPSAKWEIQAGIVYTISENKINNKGITMLTPSGKSIYPYEMLQNEYGRPLAIPRNYRLSFVDTAGNGKLFDWKYRPLEELAMADNKSTLNDALFNLGISFKPIKNISLQVKYSYERQTGEGADHYRQESFLARDMINLFTLINGSQIKYQVPVGGILDQSYSKLSSHNARGQANYNKSWSGGIHEIAFLAGAELRESRMRITSNRLYGYDDELLSSGSVNYVDLLNTYNNVGSIRQISRADYLSGTVNRFVSVFANGSYTYQSRYILSVSVRRDASNIFGVNTNQKWVPLWSTGLSWQINKEKFYHLSWLPYLKLRTTFGYNGNVDENLSAYPTILYSSFPAQFNNLIYADMNTPPNPELRWEKVGMFNVGIDFATKNSRIEGSIDYYLKKGTDLIGETPIDPTTGVQTLSLAFTYKGNVADMKGNGLELELNTKNLDGVIKWDTRFQFNYVSTEITKYNYKNARSGAYVTDGIAISPLAGKSVFALLSYQWAGLDPQTGDPRGYDENKQVSKDYTALINAKTEDLQYHGPARPTTYGFLINTISWKELSFSFNIAYKLGYYFRRTSISYGSLFSNWKAHADYLVRWQKPGDETFTNVPSLVYPNNSNRDVFYAGSAALVEKGDHIRLQDISLSWHLKPSWLSTLHMKELRLYTYLNNLGIIWKANKAGVDPDYFDRGFPLPRTIAIGIKASF